MIPLTQKLAGNELFNFAAFLRDEWRTNDWMWGRLDAVSTLVGLLVTPETIGHWLLATPTRSTRCTVSSSATSQPRPTSGWPTWLDHNVWAVYREQIAMEIAALQAGEDAPRLDAIRGALTARRQWEILADELGRSVRTRAGRPRAPPAR